MTQQRSDHPFSRYRPLIDDWDAFQAAIQRPLPTCIWTNTLRTTPARLQALLAADGLPLEPVSWYPGAFTLPPDFGPGLHWQYLAGLYQVQEEVALLPVVLLDPQPGERILDLCAAPGNKTAQLAIALRNQGTVVANDWNPGRMRAVRQTLDRLGLVNVSLTTVDGANYPKEAGLFDKVLVDVPCTGEGTCRKDPGVIERTGASFSNRMIGAQRALLRKAVQLCRPGGRIVYATCTFAPEENEMVVDDILRETGSHTLRLLPAEVPGFTTSPGITEWHGRAFDDSLRLTMRVWPHQNDTGGFFVAVVEKGVGRQRAVGSGQPKVAWAVSSKQLAERERRVGMVSERFGIEPDRFDGYTIFRGSRRRVYVVNSDHWPPAQPAPDAVGLVFMQTSGKYPKLTTAAAMLFGPWARRNVIDLEAEQAEAYLSRQDFALTAGQARYCTGTGYVLLRYQNFVLGVGVYRLRTDSAFVESLYPKAWSRSGVAV
ncbi:MAG TPA: RsmB/NOP family class I SAM-dependent RNA methyltransferase [Anaerolineae bacterium]